MPFHLPSAVDTILSLLTIVALSINRFSILILIDKNVSKQLTSKMWRHRLFFLIFFNGFEKL